MPSPQSNGRARQTEQLDSDESHKSNGDYAFGDNDDANSESELGDTVQPCLNGSAMAASTNGEAGHSRRPLLLDVVRPTTIFTKATGTDCDDMANGFARKSAIPLNRLESRNLNGINVRFEQIVHKTQGRLCWNRGE